MIRAKSSALKFFGSISGNQSFGMSRFFIEHLLLRV